MSKKSWLGGSNRETDDAAAESNPHNEAAAQRPGSEPQDTASTEPSQGGQQGVTGESLPVSQLNQGASTTTTPDSQRGDTAQTQSVGSLDTMSAEERLEKLRGWQSRTRLGGPRQADWEEFDQIVGAQDHSETPGVEVQSGEDRRP
jgi:hypothetical protein